LKVLKLFFGWCVDRDIVTGSPAATLKRPTKEKPRKRVLSDDELRAFWRANETLDWPFGRIGQVRTAGQ
jgi:integrase